MRSFWKNARFVERFENSHCSNFQNRLFFSLLYFWLLVQSTFDCRRYLNLSRRDQSSIDCASAFASKKAFQQCWRRATPLPDLRNWDWERKSGGFSEFRGWKFCSEKTASSSRHARVLLWSMNLSFSLTAFPLPDPPCCLELHFWKNVFQTSAACHPSNH